MIRGLVITLAAVLMWAAPMGASATGTFLGTLGWCMGMLVMALPAFLIAGGILFIWAIWPVRE